MSAEGRAAGAAAEHVIARAVEEAGVRESAPLVRQTAEQAAREGERSIASRGEALGERRLGTGPEAATERGPRAGEDPAASAVTDSRGREVPANVQRLPSGRLPANYQYAGRTYDGPAWTQDLAAKYPDGVRFTQDGYPDFSPYATHTVQVDPHFEGNRTTDFTRANRLAGLKRKPSGYTWHHHQDGTTMHLVPDDIHQAVRHAGGVALRRNRT